ncbi:nucleolar protein [Tanacetum coccineum]
MYRAQREDILSRQGVEGMLRVLSLSVGIFLIFSELFYIKEKLDSVPYISIVMLAVQAVGYGIPLVTGAEALFKKSKSYEEDSSVLQKSQMIQVIDYTVKILVLVSFSLTLRIYQKVWRSRIRLLTRAPLEPNRVPSERGVLIVTAVAHALGFVTVLVIHSLQSWLVELEEYVGLVQDLFLLPQVIAIVVHAQQKFGYEKLAGLLDFGKFRVLPRHSVAYERLSPVVEAEMTSGVDRDRKEVDIE